MTVTRVQLVSNVSTGASFTGVVTATTFRGSLTGTASTASFATTSFGLSGTPNITIGNVTSSDITATNINSSGIVTASSFSGNLTGNVTGNATGLSGNPSITVTNATVNGVLSVGGTTVILNAATLKIQDRDITLGVTTDALNNDVSNDTTANHGGISVASTIGTPLINIPIDAVNLDPSTYKQLMWVKQNHYTGLGTDAWISNYPISIGNTATVQNGSRLTVGAGFTVYEGYLDAQDIRSRNLNTSGIGTIIDTRVQSIGEKTTRTSGNTASLVYNTGGGNIAICTNPSGDITLAVTGIPVDTSFNDTAITFSVFVSQTGTARSCTAVTLNGFNAPIRWAGGSLASAIAGVTTTTGMDIYSFTGINTVGSASTTANYYLLGVVNGGYR